MDPITLPPPVKLSAYTNCHEFQSYVASIAHTSSLIRLSTYNVGIHPETCSMVRSFVGQLARAGEVQLLVGINPHHNENPTIFRALRSFLEGNPNLKIKWASRIHAKILILDPKTSFTGSLNLIHPTLFDVMVSCNIAQTKILTDFFDSHWKRASSVIAVQ